MEHLSREKSSKAIKLLSAMMHKAWPDQLNLENDLSGKREREILLHHLLTWSSWPGFLKFIGKTVITIKDTLGMGGHTKIYFCCVLMF